MGAMTKNETQPELTVSPGEQGQSLYRLWTAARGVLARARKTVERLERELKEARSSVQQAEAQEKQRNDEFVAWVDRTQD